MQHKAVLIVAALADEVRPFLDEFEFVAVTSWSSFIPSKVVHHPMLYWSKGFGNKPGFFFLECGVGPVVSSINLTRALAVIAASATLPDVSKVFLVGTSAAASEKLDLFSIYSASYSVDSMNLQPTPFSPYSNPVMNISIHDGALHLQNITALSSPAFVSGDDKALLAKAFREATTERAPPAIDMETFGLTLVCSSFRVPFHCFRAISESFPPAEGSCFETWQKNVVECSKRLSALIKQLLAFEEKYA